MMQLLDEMSVKPK